MTELEHYTIELRDVDGVYAHLIEQIGPARRQRLGEVVKGLLREQAEQELQDLRDRADRLEQLLAVNGHGPEIPTREELEAEGDDWRRELEPGADRPGSEDEHAPPAADPAPDAGPPTDPPAAPEPSPPAAGDLPGVDQRAEARYTGKALAERLQPDDVRRAIRELGKGTRRSITIHLGLTSGTSAVVDRHIEELERAGRIRQDGTRRGHPLYTAAGPDVEEEPESAQEDESPWIDPGAADPPPRRSQPAGGAEDVLVTVQREIRQTLGHGPARIPKIATEHDRPPAQVAQAMELLKREGAVEKIPGGEYARTDLL